MAEHRNPAVTVDAICIIDGRIVLIRRGRPPFKGHYALPGGFVDYGETTEHAVLRELKEETGLDGRVVRLFGVYSDPRRDPRGHTISIVYLVESLSNSGALRGGDDAAEAKLFYLDDLPQLAFDHQTILEAYRCSVQTANH